ncbi:MAG: T9SS type A sorting domain-containing protein [Candidatus Hatepunaea meridiana]|nr:T9SS type A sorting domain-containing protein [Candidatus Hatepunaea meridiana]
MKSKILKPILLIVFILALLPGNTPAEPITYYQYITNFERTRFNEIIWFWSQDTLEGPVRSNDYIGLKYSPHFFGQVSTSQDRFLYLNPINIYFAYPPRLNYPPFLFPETYPHLIRLASPIINDGDGRLMTRVWFRGEHGIVIYPYRLGSEPPPLYGDIDDLQNVRQLRPPSWQIIYIDGQCEVYGELFGRLTVYSSSDMYLIDDIYYEGADRRSGQYNEENMEHILGLVSDRNITIRNNWYNGRDNGYRRYGSQETDRHSITINGSLIALDESFNFEQQNDNWEPYQGPSPDERGIINHKGGIAQWRRGYVHRINHNRTGYGKCRRYDFRLLTTGPPGFDPNFYPNITGSYDRLDLANGPYTISNATVRTMIVRPGVEITLNGIDALRVRDSLIVLGSEDNPVTFESSKECNHGHIWVQLSRGSVTDLQHTVMPSTISLHLESERVNIENCIINCTVNASGNIHLANNSFAAPVDLTSFNRIMVERNVFTGGMKIKGNVQDGRIYNNTIVNGRHSGLELRRFRNLEIINNIIAFNEKGIDNRHWDVPVLRYNDVYGHSCGNYVECEPGEGSISANPHFINTQLGNYRLVWCSPCIDSGDPDFPRDPDGSIVEMGAFYYDPERSIDEDPAQIMDFGLSIAPNPFNRKTYLQVKTIIPGIAYIKVYDLSGRKVYEDIERVSLGMNRIKLDGKCLGGAGVYFVQVMTSGWTQTVKMVYLP